MASTILRKATDPRRISETFIKRHATRLVHWAGRFWTYDGGVYVELPPATLRAQLTQCAQRLADADFTRAAAKAKQLEKAPGVALPITARVVDDALKMLRAMTHTTIGQVPAWLDAPPDNAPTASFINVRDGLLDITEDVPHLWEHTDDWFSVVQLPYKGAFETDYYDIDDATGEVEYVPAELDEDDNPIPTPQACHRWIAYLEEMLEGDQERIDVLQEWFGYSLVADTSQQAMLFLLGEAGSGKSTVLNTLQAVVGKANVSNVALENFHRPFSLHGTLGKLINVATEAMQKFPPSALGILKTFTAGERMRFEQKYEDEINEYPTARVILAGNVLPEFYDPSNGVWRRLTIMPFNHVIPEELHDRTLGDQFSEELGGIFHWALAGLRRLRANTRFTKSTQCEAAKRTQRREQDPLTMTLLDLLEVSDGKTSVSTESVRFQVNAADIHADSQTIGRRIKLLFPKSENRQRRLPGGAKPNHYFGLKFREAAMQHAEAS